MAVSTETPHAEALALVNHLKTKITIATAIVMIKSARTEGIPSTEFTRNFQEEYFTKVQGKINPALEQRFLHHRQEELLNKLKKAIPSPAHQPDVRQEQDEQINSDDGSMDWFDDWTTVPKTGCVKEKSPLHSSQRIAPLVPTYNNLYSSEQFTLKNIEFMESIMRLSEESERKTPIPISVLQSLLYDEADCVSEPQSWNNCWDNGNKHYSEDSGIACSERQTTNSSSVNFMSGGWIKNMLETSNCKQIVLYSTKSVGSFVKNEIKMKPVEVLCNWQGSLMEYARDILCECSRSNSDCEGVFLNLIFDMMEDVWSDSTSSQHRQSEIKILVIKEFLTSEICYEVLQYISEKLDYFMRCFSNNSNSVPMIAEKLRLFLNLYSNVCVTTKLLKAKTTSLRSVKNMDSEENSVIKLWQEKWCEKDANDDDKGYAAMMNESEIDNLERFVITVSFKYPLMAMLAMETLEKAKDLFRPDENLSQESFL